MSRSGRWEGWIWLAGVLLVFCTGLTGADSSVGDGWTPKRFKPLFSSEAGEQPYVLGKSFGLEDWPYLDGQWKGLLCARDGQVYFSVSSHAPGYHADVFRFNVREERIEHLANLGDILEHTEPPEAPQDKIHTPMFEVGDWIYAATCEGAESPDLEYKGGNWIGIHKPTGKVHDLGRTKTGDGILAAGYDPARGVLYGHTNRKGRLVRFDPKTREEEDLGFPWEGTGAEWPRGISLLVAPDGRVFGGRPPGATFWEWDPKTDNIRILGAEMEPPAELVEATPGILDQYAGSSIHVGRWSDEDTCFYFVRSFDERLGRFYPPTETSPARIESVATLRPEGLERRYGNRPVSCTLILHERSIYYSPMTGWGGEASLVHFDLDREELTDLGPIVVEGNRRVAEVHSLDIHPNGKLYMVAFVYSIEGEDPVVPNAVRDGYPFHPRLVVVDPTEALRRLSGEAPQ